MKLLLLIKGFIIGAGLSFPVGPIGILCLRRLLVQGPLIGIASGLGAATADLIFAIIALVGIGFISSLMTYQFILFKLLSSIFMCMIGAHIFLSKAAKTPTNLGHGLLESYFSTLFLTLANPSAILGLIAALTLIGVTSFTGYTTATTLATGIFLGSSALWISLGAFAHYFSIKIRPSHLTTINKISGAAIVAFGVGSLISLLTHLYPR